MSELTLSAQKYMGFFQKSRQSGYKLRIEMTRPSPTGIVSAQKYHFNQRPYGINPISIVEQFRGKVPSMNEVFYLVGLIGQRLMEIIVIPQTELTEILRHRLGTSLFEGITSVSFNPLVIKMSKGNKKTRGKQQNKRRNSGNTISNTYGNNGGVRQKIPSPSHSGGNNSIWYHGTARKDVASADDLDPTRGNKFGDFGKGVYLTDTYSIAEAYSKTIKGVFTENSKVFEFTCLNDELNEIYNEIQQGHFPDKQVCTLTYGEKSFRVVVFARRCREWSDAVLDGWSGKRVTDGNSNCDLVLGPLSQSDIEDIAKGYIRDLKRVGDEGITNDIRKDFLSEVQVQKMNGKVVFQLCCYNKEIIKYIFVAGK